MSLPLKISLLTLDSGDRVFCHLAEEGGVGGPGESGLKSWSEARLRKLKDGLRQSPTRAARATRRVLSWLNRLTHADERLLSRLRNARRIVIEHPTSMTEPEVRACWDEFLARSLRRHRPWFVVNAAASPLTVPLALLPGPNFVGYWVVFRAWRHGGILLGLRRVGGGGVPISFRPSPDLDVPRADPRRLADQDAESRAALGITRPR